MKNIYIIGIFGLLLLSGCNHTIDNSSESHNTGSIETNSGQQNQNSGGATDLTGYTNTGNQLTDLSPNNPTMENTINPIVTQALQALEKGDKNLWFSLFADNVKFTDDGRELEFQSFWNNAIGQERFTAIDVVEDNGTTIKGPFHTVQRGDFNVFFTFHIDGNNKIVGLDIGQRKK